MGNNKIINAILLVLSIIWQLPQNIVALIMLPFLGKLELISFRKFCWCFKGKNMRGGISLGNFAFVSPTSAKYPVYVVHEQLGHTVQSKILGPLYLLVIGIPSIIHAWLHEDCPCYYHFYTEKWANKCAGIKTYYTKSGHCYISLK
jgi:hypothetical protein